MKIGIDCRMWFETGIGRYTRNIVSEISKLDSSNEYVLFLLKDDISKVHLPTNFKKVAVNVRWYTWLEQLVMPFYYYKEGLDMLFVPNLNVPIFYFKKFVVTVHDLTVLHIKTGKASKKAYPYYLFKRAMVKLPLLYIKYFAKKIFVVSDFVKQDFIRHFGVDEAKILLTPCAVGDEFSLAAVEIIESTLRTYNISRPYLFYVGNAHPHKNLERLIQAFKLVRREFSELTLVLGGKDGFFFDELRKEFANDEVMASVKFTGFILDADLPALYSGSEAFVNPSLFEGFGIQLLEAFACETKVVCSNTTSLPEVGHDAAYYFNPRDVEDMAQNIIKCLNSEHAQKKEAGILRVADFSWSKSAKVVHETCTGF